MQVAFSGGFAKLNASDRNEGCHIALKNLLFTGETVFGSSSGVWRLGVRFGSIWCGRVGIVVGSWSQSFEQGVGKKVCLTSGWPIRNSSGRLLGRFG